LVAKAEYNIKYQNQINKQLPRVKEKINYIGVELTGYGKIIRVKGRLKNLLRQWPRKKLRKKLPKSQLFVGAAESRCQSASAN